MGGLPSSGVLDPDGPDPAVEGTMREEATRPRPPAPPADFDVERVRGAVLGRRVCLIPPGVAYGLRTVFEINLFGAAAA